MDLAQPDIAASDTRPSAAASPVPATDAASPFAAWLGYFRDNPRRQRAIEEAVDWAAPLALRPAAARNVGRSLQRFELGESGDGVHLIGLADRAGDPVYTAAVRLLVKEEQRHSELFGRGLRHLGVPSLDGHWSDRVFTLLRRSIGLRTELALFLVAETVALELFLALEASADPVLAGIGHRIATDEREHIRFQIDRLHQGAEQWTVPGRLGAALLWTAVAAGAATVLATGHAPALRTLGRSPLIVWLRGMHGFWSAARLALGGPHGRFLGPSPHATRS